MDAPDELSRQMLSHLIRMDYDCHMALVAVTPCRDHQCGVTRYIVATDNTSREFATVIASSVWELHSKEET